MFSIVSVFFEVFNIYHAPPLVGCSYHVTGLSVDNLLCSLVLPKITTLAALLPRISTGSTSSWRCVGCPDTERHHPVTHNLYLCRLMTGMTHSSTPFITVYWCLMAKHTIKWVTGSVCSSYTAYFLFFCSLTANKKPWITWIMYEVYFVQEHLLWCNAA